MAAKKKTIKNSGRKKPTTKTKSNKRQRLDLRHLLPQVILNKDTAGLEKEDSEGAESSIMPPGNGISQTPLAYNVSGASPGHGDAYSVSEKNQIEEKELFDSSQIRVSYKEFPIDLVLRRISRGELNLSPDFQRTAGIWNDGAQSRLIESLLIRIPIPVFYIDGSEDDEWIVIDGLQRLNTLKRFALDKNLRLRDLEFLTDLHGKNFDQLPKSLQRRILESAIGLYLIEKGTPEQVKLSIFHRINTGGLPLSSQEIRHALYRGQAAKFLNKLVHSDEFKTATDNGIGEERMADRECVLRCLAFMLTHYSKYKVKDMDGFLNDAMRKIQFCNSDELENLEKRFKRSMNINFEIFGKDAFRKLYIDQKDRNPINRSLFEVWAVCLDQLKDKEIAKLKSKRNILKSNFIELIKSNSDFTSSITTGTGELKKVQLRFSTIERLVKEVIRD